MYFHHYAPFLDDEDGIFNHEQLSLHHSSNTRRRHRHIQEADVDNVTNQRLIHRAWGEARSSVTTKVTCYSISLQNHLIRMIKPYER